MRGKRLKCTITNTETNESKTLYSFKDAIKEIGYEKSLYTFLQHNYEAYRNKRIEYGKYVITIVGDVAFNCFGGDTIVGEKNWVREMFTEEEILIMRDIVNGVRPMSDYDKIIKNRNEFGE